MRVRNGILTIAWLLLAASALAQGDPRSGDWELRLGEERREREFLAGPEILDPFFEFCVALIEGDSLGVWTRADVEARVAASGRPTSLPVERLVRLERRAVPDSLVRVRRFARAGRELELTLDADLQLPLPYSILGYHPGDLHVSRRVLMTEWDIGDHGLRLDRGHDGRPYGLGAAGLRALVVDAGWVVLDVDGWLDKILGRKLDDTWIEVFVLGRVVRAAVAEDLGLHGLALGRARNGRALAGSFDFRRNKVLPNGRPVARAFSGLVRPMLAPYDEPADSRAWDWPGGR